MVGSSKTRAEPQVDWAGIGAWIEERRRAAGLSTTEAARQARVSRTTWSQFEGGVKRHPTDEALIRVAKVIGVDPVEMMTRCRRPYPDIPSLRQLAPVGAPLGLLQLLEADGRLDEKSRRLLVELYEALASR